MKKGQTTIFIILGLLLVIILGLFVGYRQSFSAKQSAIEIKGIETLSPELKEAGNTVESCIKENAQQGLILLGLQGGHLNDEVETFKYNDVKVSYNFIDNKNQLPSREDMAQSLAEYLKENVKDCLSNVDDKFEVIPSSIYSVNVDIGDNDVLFKIKWPVMFKKDDIESRIDGFIFSLPVRLGILHNEVTGFITEQVSNPEEICLSCLLESSQKNSFEIEVENYITTFVVIINDKQSSLDKVKPYKFMFANGY